VWAERRSTCVRSRFARVLRVVTVFMAGLVLFPCISISDDYARARLQDVSSTPGRPVVARGGGSSGLLLATQLEETEHIRPVTPFVLVLVLCSLLLILSETSRTRSSLRWGTFGRAPPAF
jgi:hypothetical protein